MKKQYLSSLVFVFCIAFLFQSFYAEEGMWPKG
jgi:hypothetical protein